MCSNEHLFDGFGPAFRGSSPGQAAVPQQREGLEMATGVLAMGGSFERPALAGPMQLTIRGRMVAVLAVLVALPALLLAARVLAGPVEVPSVQASAGVAGEAVAAVPGAVLADQGLARSHTVLPGETLWSLATGLGPAADPRPLVGELRYLNAMEGSELAVGQQLWLPVLAGDDGATVGS